MNQFLLQGMKFIREANREKDPGSLMDKGLLDEESPGLGVSGKPGMSGWKVELERLALRQRKGLMTCWVAGPHPADVETTVGFQ